VAGREPSWWYGAGPSWQARLLSPIGSIVGQIAAARLRNGHPYRARLPVICVGNFTAGGSGKTPLALLIAQLVSDERRAPWFLSRGYGGDLKGPVRVEPGRHTAREVGDEPLLLAGRAPTVIARDRREGAQAIEAGAPTEAVIIMDDGLQNPALAKDLSIAVVDSVRGFGNGRVIPAGPLRAPLSVQIPLADLIVIGGRRQTGDTAVVRFLREATRAPIIFVETRATAAAEAFRGQRVIAYAGIANPERFFQTLESLGAVIVERHTFGDHHVFSDREALGLIDAARLTSAALVTTEKDLARLFGASGAGAELKQRSQALAIETVIEGEDLAKLKALIRRALAR
jgi:tetraacyldisaccharide 4'-kinase